MQSKPPSRTAPQTAAGEAEAVARNARRIRLAIIGLAVLAVLVFAFFLYRAAQEESALERWDVYEELRKKYEPSQDPIWENPYGVYNPERERYISALEKFLDTKAKEEHDALEPHTRFMIAKTLADHILSNPAAIDPEKRADWYRKGIAQLEALRDDFPDFPLNWTNLSAEGFPSLTRQFIDWFERNQAWEKEHLLGSKAPDERVRVLIRTERGDLLLGLYREDAPKWTADFIARAQRGDYDGTLFHSKEEVGDVAEPQKHLVRGGAAMLRDAKAFDAKQHLELSKRKMRSGRLLEEARNVIAQERGIVSAWHAAGDEYDHDAQFIVAVRRSPILDYAYTPIGKLLDEDGVASLQTLDRIFGASTWRDDDDVRKNTDMTGVLDFFQAPVKIVKVLVYENGALVAPAGEAAPTKAPAEDSEQALASIQADRYKVEPPARPQAPADDNDGAPADGSPDGEDK